MHELFLYEGAPMHFFARFGLDLEDFLPQLTQLLQHHFAHL